MTILRRDLFNQAPYVTPVQQAVTAFTPPGVIKGNLGVIDQERDPWTAAVVAVPKYGTVELDLENPGGRYTYTAGPTFSGSDSFTVKIAQVKPDINLLAPFSDGAKTVTIQVGDGAMNHPWESSVLTSGLPAAPTHQDPTDAALYLPDAPVDIRIEKVGGKYQATVTTKTITDKTKLTWMTPTGSTGVIDARGFVTQNWDEYKLKSTENGATGAMMTIDFIDSASGKDQSVVLTNLGDPTVTADGQIKFTGLLAPDPDLSRADEINQWDILGPSFKKSYEAFRQTYGLDSNVQGPVTVSLSKSALFVDNYTTLSYQQDGLVKEATTGTTAAAGAPTSAANPVGEGGAVVEGSPAWPFNRDLTGVTVAIPFGGNGAFLTGLGTGEVDQWVSGQMTQLMNGGWKSAVTTMLEISRPLLDAEGKPVTTSFTGRIDNSGETSQSNAEPQAGNTLTITAVADGAAIVVGREIAGPGIAVDTKIVSFLSGSPGGVGTYQVSGPAQKVETASFTQPSVPVLEPGFVVGLADGAVEQWTASKGWTELKGVSQPGPSASTRAVRTMMKNGDGFVAGFADGAVWRYSPTDGWTQNNVGSGVNTMMPYGEPAQGQFIVGLQDGSVKQWTGTGFKVLQDTGWKSPVTAMIPYSRYGEEGFVVGLGNGAVENWNGSRWTELHDTGWQSAVTAIVPWNDEQGRGFVVGLADGAVQRWIANSSEWVELQGTGWQSAVRNMIVYSATELDPDGNLSARPVGLIAGLANGAVEFWRPSPNANPRGSWTELHDVGWSNSVNALIPIHQYVTDELGNPVLRETVVAGLGSSNGGLGTVQQWNGASWTELDRGAVTLTEDLARQAVDFGWAKGGKAGDPGDPLFGVGARYADSLLPGCNYTSDCDGNYYPIDVRIGSAGEPKSLAGTNFKVPGTDPVTSVDLSYDLNAFAYGYAWVPNGVLNKLRPGKYSVATLIAIPTGPSLTLKTGPGGVISSGDVSLLSAQPFYGVYPFGTVGVDVGANGKLEARLNTTDDKKAFRAWAYYVPTVLWTFNTQGNPGSIQLGYNAYPEVNFEDFKSIESVTLTPTLTPFASIKYGLFTPKNTPILGEFSVFDAGLRYENPVSLTLKVPTAGQDATLELSSKGDLTANAGILSTVTDLLTWKSTWEVYKYENQLWTNGSAGSPEAVPMAV